MQGGFVEFLALIGAVVIGWWIIQSFKFTAFKGRIIGALVSHGISKEEADLIYAANTQKIHDLHFKLDLGPEEIAAAIIRELG